MSGEPTTSGGIGGSKQEYEAYLRVNEQFAKCVAGGTSIPVLAANDLCSWMANMFPTATTQVCRDQFGGDIVDRSGLITVYADAEAEEDD